MFNFSQITPQERKQLYHVIIILVCLYATVHLLQGVDDDEPLGSGWFGDITHFARKQYNKAKKSYDKFVPRKVRKGVHKAAKSVEKEANKGVKVVTKEAKKL